MSNLLKLTLAAAALIAIALTLGLGASQIADSQRDMTETTE